MTNFTFYCKNILTQDMVTDGFSVNSALHHQSANASE